ncbi:N-6 DNA methylase [Sulfurovum sp. zt1-1]|uniref:N-6 DNA methylase n=1 Tax=Sulfurovum zhangzhouensis TaxID=3019067 RepID=A0ABT7QVD5_9BACT|nr:N-6 DNA methylase [Sulfurovum zhangzhouensis]MDM5270791.1 N-6 DNA methylase [Sulfurovum zhangzhouensis]
MTWQERIEDKLQNQKNKVTSINIDRKEIAYNEKIKLHRQIETITGDEEITRAFLIDRLINELDYPAELIELEKEYNIGRPKVQKARIDVIVKDKDNKPFFFIEVKAPDKYESDKEYIEGQLYQLAKLEPLKPKYLVYYTTEENEDHIHDRLIIIDYEKYPDYNDWVNDGLVSVGSELTAGYDKPKKQAYIKGHDKHDLKTKIKKQEIEALAKNLHNVLWGGGGTTDSEIFYSLVNIILAKLQDESEREDNEEYHFQIHQYGENTENLNRIFDRVNELYRRALQEKLNITDETKIAKAYVINEEKFPLNKLVYCVSQLEPYSFYDGRNSIDGKDILGDFFESITRDGFKQTKGQFFTPTPVVNFILYALHLDSYAIDRLNNDRELPYIIDPSAGSATYLVEAMKVITKELKYKQRDKLKANRQTKDLIEDLFGKDKEKHKENKWAKEYLYGADINFDLGIASKVNMILHGDGSTNIFVKDGLLPFRFYTKDTAPNHLSKNEPDDLYSDKDVNGNFDVVISNPPFSVDLDTETKRFLPNNFLFGDKKNSENLFIERWYQLLKENGRVGVVLPESVFDTTENKYIRLFIFKYFKVKAVVSLPQVTFEPYTSTKTSLLFMQKKTKEEIAKWNKLWDSYGSEWNNLKTRVLNLSDVYLKGKDRKKLPSIKDLNEKEELVILYRILKDYFGEEDKHLTPEELIRKYQNELGELCKFDKDTTDVFGFYNPWWVFGEVAKEMDYDIFMAEAENVGYKRTKRGEKSMPNDLFDIEFAPYKLELDAIERYYDELIARDNHLLIELCNERDELQKKIDIKTNKTLERKFVTVCQDIDKVEKRLKALDDEKKEGLEIHNTYYQNNNEIKDEYFDRTDEILINHFKNGMMQRWASSDILLRKNQEVKILDSIRKSVKWD